MWKIYGLDIRKLTEQGLLEEYLGRLPAERQAHIRNIKNTAEQYRSMGAGLLLEYGLAQAGVPAEDAKVLQGKYGKPYLAQDQGVFFNVSHSGDYAVAVFADVEVGIDIEHRRNLRKGTAERTCTGKELAWMSEQADKEMAFVRLWTAKESYVKWTGRGLTGLLTDIEVQAEQTENGNLRRKCGVVLKRTGDKTPAALYEYPAPKDYGICICVNAGRAESSAAAWNEEMASADIQWITIEELMRG